MIAASMLRQYSWRIAGSRRLKMASLPKNTAGISEEEARKLIIKAYADRLDVMAIALAVGSQWWQVRVIVNHQKYDYDAMTSLLTREIELRDQLEGISLEVDYIPQMSRPIEDVVPHHTIVIFKR
jgi:hypothetical protein